MTNEEDKAISLQEAINAMQALQDEDIETYGVWIPECFDGKRAIEALKQLKPVRLTEKAEQEQYYKNLANSYEKTINKLTKAISEQEPKTGKWIPDGYRTEEDWIRGRETYKCPFCGYRDNCNHRSNYCPNCGAKMESEGCV